jgi:hypothetical protein
MAHKGRYAYILSAFVALLAACGSESGSLGLAPTPHEDALAYPDAGPADDDSLTGAADSFGADATGPPPDSGRELPGDTTPPTPELPAGPDVVSDDTIVVATVDPPQGTSAGGTPVMLTGAGFERGVEVWFGARQATDVFVVDAGLLTAATPPGSPGAVDVIVRRPRDDAEGRRAAGFVYSDTLVVTRVAPARGPTHGGTRLTVTGLGFRADTVVALGGRLALAVEVENHTRMTFLTPPGVAGFADLALINRSASTYARDSYRYVAPLEFDAVLPPTGTTLGGEEVTLVGAGLHLIGRVGSTGRETPEIEVWFGDVPATVLRADIDGSTLEVRTPPSAPGPVAVTVRTPDAERTLPRGFTYIDALYLEESGALVALAPERGTTDGGDTVTLVVTGLLADDVPVVDFGGVPADLLDVVPSDGIVVVRTPPHPAGRVAVGATWRGRRAFRSNAFTFEPPFRIDSVTPTRGPSAGGTAIVVRGRGFSPSSQLYVGALEAHDVVHDGDTLVARTPPGSPGPNDIQVMDGNRTATLTDAFHYESTVSALLGVEPSAGSQAGNTLVTLRGLGLPSGAHVTFGGLPAHDVQSISDIEIRARTPRAPGPGSVDVVVTAPRGGAIGLGRAYTYFDPGQVRGGTWGGPIRGALNVTVLDSSSGLGVEGAFVIVGDDPSSPLQGFTDDRGQITFSTPGLRGPVQLSATKPQYTGYSVVEFDAQNVSVWLYRAVPAVPGGGAPGEGTIYVPLEGRVTGRVDNADKYLRVPPGDCADHPGVAWPLCFYCDEDDECGEGHRCTSVSATARYCTRDCHTEADCPARFMCLSMGGDQPAQCIPRGGEPEIFCRQSDSSAFGGGIYPGVFAKVNQHREYLVLTRLGETAIYCVAGARDHSTDRFTPLAMGIRRHVLVNSDTPVTGVDITLDIPLDSALPLVYSELPPHPSGNFAPHVRGALHLGPDGYLGFESLGGRLVMADDGLSAKIVGHPAALEGPLSGATYMLYATVTPQTMTSLPYSSFYQTQIVPDDSAAVLARAADGSYTRLGEGLPDDMFGLWAATDDMVYGVGAHGRVYRRTLAGWSRQPTPSGPHLRDIDGFVADSDGRPRLWAVGDRGRFLHFDGLVWRVRAFPDGRPDLTAISVAAPDAVFVTTRKGGVLRFDGTEWHELRAEEPETLEYSEGFPGWGWGWGLVATFYQAGLHGVWAAAPDDVWVVGTRGTALRWRGHAFEDALVPTDVDLMAVHGRAAGDLVIVGDQGQTFHSVEGRFSIDWRLVPAPRPVRLRDVRLLPDGHALAVGDNGTILRWSGQAWLPDGEEVAEERHYRRVVTTGDDTAFIAGPRGLLVGPFMGYPMFATEGSVSTQPGREIAWLATGAVTPSYNQVTLSLPTGQIFWTTVLDGPESAFLLPALDILLGMPVLPAGRSRVTVTRAYTPGFNIDRYQVRDLGTFLRRTWSANGIDLINGTVGP